MAIPETSKVDEYRRLNLKTLELKGIQFTVRKMPPRVFVKAYKVFKDLQGKSREEINEYIITNLDQLSTDLLPVCVLEPKIGNPNGLTLDEIATGDAIVLVTAIIEHTLSDLPGAEAKPTEPAESEDSFRGQPS